jgi:hypothetical protein
MERLSPLERYSDANPALYDRDCAWSLRSDLFEARLRACETACHRRHVGAREAHRDVRAARDGDR